MNITDHEQADFSTHAGNQRIEMHLEWRGTPGAFWTVRVSHRDDFEPAVEIDLKQARAVALALDMFDARNKAGGSRDSGRKKRQCKAA